MVMNMSACKTKQSNTNLLNRRRLASICNWMLFRCKGSKLETVKSIFNRVITEKLIDYNQLREHDKINSIALELAQLETKMEELNSNRISLIKSLRKELLNFQPTIPKKQINKSSVSNYE